MKNIFAVEWNLLTNCPSKPISRILTYIQEGIGLFIHGNLLRNTSLVCKLQRTFYG